MSLPEILKAAISSEMDGIHTAAPGRIEKYDPATQKATVKPLVKRAYQDGEVQAMPLIHNVPVVWPRTASSSLTLKVKPGDTCLVVFCERSLERWLDSGQEVEPGVQRRHDLNDATALMGMCAFNTASPGKDNWDVYLQSGKAWVRFDEGRATLSSDDTVIQDSAGARLHLKDGKVALGAGGVELLDVLEQALQLLGSSTTTQNGTPIMNQAGYAQLASRINKIKGSL